MLDAAHKAAFDRDGFLVVRRFLEGDALAELTSNLDRYVSEIVPTLPDTAAFYQDRSRPETLKQMQYMCHDPFFESYRQNARWSDLAAQLVGEPVNAQEPEWFNKPPGTEHPTPPHQDNYYFCLKPANVLTMWVALDAADEENGCLRYVRGSHLNGIRPHNATEVLGFSQGIVDYGDEDEQLAEPICLQPGDLAVHHGQTIHRADANCSDRQRRAFAMVLRGESCERDEEAYTRYFSSMKEQQAGMGLDVK